MKSKLTLIALALLAISTLNSQLSTWAQGAPGDLDPTFAGTGTSLLGFGGGDQNCSAAAVQADGKLVLAGTAVSANLFDEFEIVRFDTNNAFDTSFGAGGTVLTPFNPTSIFAEGAGVSAVKIQSDGKIIAAGWVDSAGTYTDFALARYETNGELDASFGIDGRVITDFGTSSGIGAMAIDSDSNIVVAGYAGTNFAMARYQTNGELDASFGIGGTVMSGVGGGYGLYGADALMIESSGSYVAAGIGINGSDFAVLRYTTNGVLDPTFGGGSGEVFTPIPGFTLNYATGVATQFGNNTVQQPDKIVVVGRAFNSTLNTVLAVVRYNLDGSLDTSFGGTGIVTDTFAAGAPYASATALLVQGTGIGHARKITVAGIGSGSVNTYFGLARYNSDGSPDTTFGGGTGKATLSFGSAGADEAYALALQSGKIVLAGVSWVNFNTYNSEFAAARFNSDGSLDTTFGNSGVVTVDVCGFSGAQGVAIQSDGKVVVAGWNNNVQYLFALARYNSDGSLDGSFGVDGKLTTAVGSTNAVASAVAIQPDGKIIAAGYSYTGFYIYQDFALVRYNADGSLDSSFGSGGQVVTPLGGIYDDANAIALQSDGKIVLAGPTQTGTGVDNFGVARFTTNGALDSSFGGTGKIITTIAGGESVANGVGIQADGKIVVAGYAYVGANTNFALVRFNPDGSLDNSFGSFGRVSTAFGSGNPAYGYGLALQSDGKIIVAGQVVIGGIGYMALARYATNGALDASFGSGGQVTTQVGLTYDQANAVAVLPNGKIVVAGLSYQGSFDEYAMVRYNPDGSLDSSFGTGGKVIMSFEDIYDNGTALALDQIGRAVVVGVANDLFGVARLASEPFLKITSINQLTDGQVMLQGLGVPDGNHTLRASPNLSPGSFSPLAPITADAGGFWQYLDTSAVGLNSQFYRLSYP